MMHLLLILNVIFILIIFLWAFFCVHTSEKLVNRLAYIGIGLAATVVLITYIVPNNSFLYYPNYYSTFVWQRLLFNGAFAFKAVTDFYCAYGTAKWKEAFTNSKQSFLHLTNRT